MKIDKETWHYKLYRWWLEIKCKRIHCNYDNEIYDYDKGEYIELATASDELIHERLNITPNLCLYIKVVLLYAPFRKAINNRVFQLIWLNIALSTIIYFEFINSEFNKFMFTLGISLALIGIILGIVYIVVMSCEAIVEYRYNKYEEKKPTFYTSIVKPYIKAKKSKICPFLTFE